MPLKSSQRAIHRGTAKTRRGCGAPAIAHQQRERMSTVKSTAKGLIIREEPWRGVEGRRKDDGATAPESLASPKAVSRSGHATPHLLSIRPPLAHSLTSHDQQLREAFLILDDDEDGLLSGADLLSFIIRYRHHFTHLSEQPHGVMRREVTEYVRLVLSVAYALDTSAAAEERCQSDSLRGGDDVQIRSRDAAQHPTRSPSGRSLSAESVDFYVVARAPGFLAWRSWLSLHRAVIRHDAASKNSPRVSAFLRTTRTLFRLADQVRSAAVLASGHPLESFSRRTTPRTPDQSVDPPPIAVGALLARVQIACHSTEFEGLWSRYWRFLSRRLLSRSAACDLVAVNEVKMSRRESHLWSPRMPGTRNTPASPWAPQLTTPRYSLSIDGKRFEVAALYSSIRAAVANISGGASGSITMSLEGWTRAVEAILWQLLPHEDLFDPAAAYSADTVSPWTYGVCLDWSLIIIIAASEAASLWATLLTCYLLAPPTSSAQGLPGSVFVRTAAEVCGQFPAFLLYVSTQHLLSLHASCWHGTRSMLQYDAARIELPLADRCPEDTEKRADIRCAAAHMMTTRVTDAVMSIAGTGTIPKLPWSQGRSGAHLVAWLFRILLFTLARLCALEAGSPFFSHNRWRSLAILLLCCQAIVVARQTARTQRIVAWNLVQRRMSERMAKDLLTAYGLPYPWSSTTPSARVSTDTIAASNRRLPTVAFRIPLPLSLDLWRLCTYFRSVLFHGSDGAPALQAYWDYVKSATVFASTSLRFSADGRPPRLVEGVCPNVPGTVLHQWASEKPDTGEPLLPWWRGHTYDRAAARAVITEDIDAIVSAVSGVSSPAKEVEVTAWDGPTQRDAECVAVCGTMLLLLSLGPFDVDSAISVPKQLAQAWSHVLYVDGTSSDQNLCKIQLHLKALCQSYRRTLWSQQQAAPTRNGVGNVDLYPLQILASASYLVRWMWAAAVHRPCEEAF